MKLDLDKELTRGPRVPRWRRRAGLILCIFLFGVVIAFAAGAYRTFRITSGSMEPTLRIGDFILVRANGKRTPRVGEIAALRNPHEPMQWLCKRVVAQPGDVIMFRQGFFFRNGEIQDDEPYVAAHRIEGLPDVGPYQLEGDRYFVLGDNRRVSYDSLDFGPVPQGDFIGVAVAVYWPWSHRRWLGGRR